MLQPLGMTDPHLVPVLPGLVAKLLPMHVVTHRDLRKVPRIRAVFDHLVEELTRFAQG